jgi:hypothetical protein
MPVYPITFSIPEEKIVADLQSKTKLISSLIPGQLSTYIYSNEKDYYDEYRQSIFATTTKKAGWDCMRHYEIMANGCIPYFPDLARCPPKIMALLPKDLIQAGTDLYLKIKNQSLEEVSNNEECKTLAKKLLEYTREHLTTRAMANYILTTSSQTAATKILYLSCDIGPDYLRCVTLHGFKALFGKACHDYPKIPHIYMGSYSHLYGRGITYTNLLEHELHDDSADNTIIDDIINKKYDIVVYGSYHRGIPFFDIVKTVYTPEQIIFMCGEDAHDCNYRNYSKHPVFVRELV